MLCKVIFVCFTVILASLNGAESGVLDIFNIKSERNLASALDSVFAVPRNDIELVLEGEITTPIEEDVTFWCGNRQSSQLVQTLLDDPAVRQKIDFTKRLILITHGWLDGHNASWIQQTAQDAIQILDTNVCIVGWDHLSKYNYFQAAKENVRLVSDYLTRFVTFLNKMGLPFDKITLVGHSLGGQICGQVGHNLDGKIWEIYGLDPAGPLFTFPLDAGLENRLDRKDAKYVQMILTSRRTLGVSQGDGHENFHPDGGTSPQQNCIFPVTSDAEATDQIVCSHLHATTLFRLAIHPPIVYRARKCFSWAAYVTKLCAHNPCDILGVYSRKLCGDFYLKTSATAPYVKNKDN